LLINKSGVLTRRDCRSSWQSSDDDVGDPLRSGVDGGVVVGVTVAVDEDLVVFSKTFETVLVVFNNDVAGVESRTSWHTTLIDEPG
jgi:methyl coenzyme M reductase gamma subunit